MERPIRIGVLGAARITDLAMVKPAHATGHRVGEIADFVVFLLSGRSGVVTGSVIDWDQNVLGGMD
jgi:hypothetical protein